MARTQVSLSADSHLSDGTPDIPHLQYKPAPQAEQLHLIRAEILANIIQRTAEREGIAPNQFKILDVGCGRGELMRALRARGFDVQGIDIDPQCVAFSSPYGKCSLGSVEQLPKLFEERSFDLIVLSHVLEHLYDPVGAVGILLRTSRRWLLFAVPNPICPLAIYKSLRQKRWSNPTHIMVWDFSHFHYFLTRAVHLQVVQETGDFVEVFHGRLRKALFNLGFGRTMEWLEQHLLFRLFPQFSTSIICLCEPTEADDLSDLARGKVD